MEFRNGDFTLKMSGGFYKTTTSGFEKGTNTNQTRQQVEAKSGTMSGSANKDGRKDHVKEALEKIASDKIKKTFLKSKYSGPVQDLKKVIDTEKANCAQYRANMAYVEEKKGKVSGKDAKKLSWFSKRSKREHEKSVATIKEMEKAVNSTAIMTTVDNLCLQHGWVYPEMPEPKKKKTKTDDNEGIIEQRGDIKIKSED